MKHEFCDYEVSNELSNLAFCGKVFGHYHIKLKELTNGFIQDKVSFAYIKAPLWQQAIDFFLDKFGIWIEISTSPIRFYDADEKLIPPKYQFMLENIRDQNEYYIHHSADDGLFYDNYKESRRAAILKAIEVCKKIKH